MAELAAGDKSIRIEGLSKVLKALEELDAAAKDDLRSLSMQAAEPVVIEAKNTVPVLTGALQRSIRAVKSSRGVKVRAGSARVPYAKPIHFGWNTHNIMANKFLFRAVDRKIDEVATVYEQGIIAIWNRNV